MFSDVLKNLKPYNTRQEIDALMNIENGPVKTLECLGDFEKPEDFSKNQLDILFFKLREISVNSNIEIEYNCVHCGKMNGGLIKIPDMFNDTSDELYDDIEIGFFNSSEIENLVDEAENIGIDEYDEIVNKYRHNNSILYQPIMTLKCLMCGESNYKDVEASECISKTSLKDIYQSITDLSVYSSQGFADVMIMIPYEREVLVALLQKLIDDGNK